MRKREVINDQLKYVGVRIILHNYVCAKLMFVIETL